MSIVGAIKLDNLSAAIFDQFKTVNGPAVIECFQKVRSAYAFKTVIHRVLDGAGCHWSKEVMNEYARNNQYIAKPKAFREKIHHFLTLRCRK